MKNIHDYGDLIADAGRTGAYAEALRSIVTPDSVVLDIGTGSGILALLACQAGARQVYAIEQDGIIQVAREGAVRNGHMDRIAFIEAFSMVAEVPESVDIIVSEIHGTLPFFPGSLASIIDARDRFLKPGGALIPMRETVWAAVVQLPEVYEKLVAPWESNFGLDCSAGRLHSVCTPKGMGYRTHELLVEPRAWCVLDYLDLKSSNARGSASWPITRAGTGHGLLTWFDCETAPGSGFSNSPLSSERHVFGQRFFPWSEPCDLEPGDFVAVEIRADEAGGRYVWSWDTDVRGPGSDSTPRARYRQSNLQGVPRSEDWLRKSDPLFVPSPTSEAHVDSLTLDLLCDGLSLQEISQRVSDRFPDRFSSWRDALPRVRDRSRQYSA